MELFSRYALWDSAFSEAAPDIWARQTFEYSGRRPLTLSVSVQFRSNPARWKVARRRCFAAEVENRIRCAGCQRTHCQRARFKLNAMFFDLAQLGVRDSYKLLTGVVVPRPIALVTSVSPSGLVNAAPYSFFNLLGSDPPVVALGVGDRKSGEGKDTASNIETSREFVVNIVDESLASAMNDCAVDFPANWSEIETLGLETTPGQVVRVPHLSGAPASLECRFHSTLHIGRNRIIVGEVVGLWVRDEFVDSQKFYVQTNEMHIIGRGGGGNEGGYFRTSDSFGLKRQSFDEWQEENGENS